MGKPRAPQHIIYRLREARKHATLENASFGEATILANGRSISNDKHIKNSTRLFRESWLIPQIDAILAWAKGEPFNKDPHA